MLDRFAKKIYEWVGRDTNWCYDLKRLSKDLFEEDYIVVLQVHTILWLSQGNVMIHLL